MKRAIAVALVMCLVASATASANPLRANLVASSIEGSGGGPGPRALPPVPYTTGFEGAALGAVEPQVVDGTLWTSSLTNHPWSSVSSLNPASGSRHLRLQSPNPGDTTNATYFAKPGDIGDGVTTPAARVVSADINLSATGGTNYTMTAGHLFANGVTGFVARMYFYAGDYDYNYTYGDILAIERVNCGDAAAVATPIGDWGSTAGSYVNYRMEIDPAAGACGQIKYYKGATLLHTGNFPFFSINPQLANTLGFTRFQPATATADVGDIDNMSLTPEPGSLALLGLGALALIRRRR